MEVVENCPVCGKKDFTQFIDCKDFTASFQTFSIQSCNGCGFLFTNPRPDETGIANYYKSDSYISHTSTSKGLINRLYHWVRGFTLNRKSAMIRSMHPSAGTLLDYGAGTGHFLNTMQKSGFEVTGLEPSPDARALAKKNLNIDLKPISAIEQFDNASFDVITLWHVMEHIHQLNKTIDDLKRILKPDGIIIIAVPNVQSYDAQHYKEYWAAYDVPRHLYHFKIDSMTQLLANHHLSVHKVLPMWFDSFYVSLLSSKYQDKSNKTPGVPGLLSAFFIGLISNLKGMGDKHRFSSLIYVVKKRA